LGAQQSSNTTVQQYGNRVTEMQGGQVIVEHVNHDAGFADCLSLASGVCCIAVMFY